MTKGKKNIIATIRTVVKSILSGDILILLRVDKLLPLLIFLFALGWINIFLNYKVEQTMVLVEKNKDILENIRNAYAVKTYEFAKAGKIGTIKEMLEKEGSDVTAPDKPAETIRTK